MNLEIANRLLALRREHGYSQEELAYKLGVSRQAVSKWERAESSPDTDNLLALARLYGVSWTRCAHHPAGERPGRAGAGGGPGGRGRGDFCRRPGLGRRGGGGAEGPEAGAGQVEGGAAVAAHPGADGDSAQPDLLARHLGGLCRGGHGGFFDHRLPAGQLAPGLDAVSHHSALLCTDLRTLKMEFPQGGNSIFCTLLVDNRAGAARHAVLGLFQEG